MPNIGHSRAPVVGADDALATGGGGTPSAECVGTPIAGHDGASTTGHVEHVAVRGGAPSIARAQLASAVIAGRRPQVSWKSLREAYQLGYPV